MNGAFDKRLKTIANEAAKHKHGALMKNSVLGNVTWYNFKMTNFKHDLNVPGARRLTTETMR